MTCQSFFVFLLISYFVTVESVDRSNLPHLNYIQSLALGPSSAVNQYFNQQQSRDPNYASYYDRQSPVNSAINNRKDSTNDASQGNLLQGNRQNTGNSFNSGVTQLQPVRPQSRVAVAPLSADVGRYDEYGQRVDIPNYVPNTEQRINTDERVSQRNDNQQRVNIQQRVHNQQTLDSQKRTKNQQNRQGQQPSQDDRVTFQDVVPERVNYGQMPPPGTKGIQATPDRNSFQATKQQQPEVVPTKTSIVITNFGLNLLKNIDKPGNAIISPLSIATSLALLQQGARGETQYQMSTALGMTPEESAVAYKQITTTIRNRASRNVLKLASSIFTANTFTVNPTFGQIASQNFGCDIGSMEFDRPVLSAMIINRWVASRTQNLIKELVTPDIITPDAQLVLANAVFFKGMWKDLFDPQLTLPMDFHLQSGETKKIPFMRLISQFRGGLDKSLGAQIVVLPFENDQYSLMMILPTDPQNVNAVMRNLDETRLLGYLQLPVKEVKLMVPRFTVKSDTNLRSVLQKIGITKIFEQQVDLSDLEISGKVSPKISSAVHTAVLTIDEKGGTAAAATAFVAVALSSDDDSIYFKADKPFLGVLWDNQLATPLFMTRIEDPGVA